MKRKTFLFLLGLLTTGAVFSQGLPEGMVSLLPEGVKANIEATRQTHKRKNLAVAGEKGVAYKAFFAADDGVHGEELWVTDGTAAGTKMVKDINPGTNTSDVNWLTRFNDKAVFAADDGTNGYELWISDGTEAGTFMLKDIHELGSSSPIGFTQLNETEFVFIAQDFDSENYSDRGAQKWLWISDGTPEGTKLLYECDARYPGRVSTAWTNHWCRVGRKVFFKADYKDGGPSEELWVTDGTPEGTYMVKDINVEENATGTADSAIDGMINFYNEKLFFKAFTIEDGNEPWASDGTEAGTYQIFDANPTKNDAGFPKSGGASCMSTYPCNGKVYFRSLTPETGSELAFSNLEPGDYTIIDINQNVPTGSNHSYPGPGTEFDGVYFFGAGTGNDATLENNYGGELHYCDGETVTMHADLAPGTLSTWAADLTVASGSLYFWSNNASTSSAPAEFKTKLYRLDSKSDASVQVTDFNPNGDLVHSLRNLGGDIIFATGDESKALYTYHYRKLGYNEETDADNLDIDIEFRTRAEIESSLANTQVIQTALYPNPTANRFSYNVPGKTVSVKVFSITGALVKEEIWPMANLVNVSSLAKGIYNVQITSTEGRYTSKLIIR